MTPALPVPPQLRLYLLGRFRLERDTQPIRFPTRKIESLLAYLVLHPGPHSREKLAAILWGGFYRYPGPRVAAECIGYRSGFCSS